MILYTKSNRLIDAVDETIMTGHAGKTLIIGDDEKSIELVEGGGGGSSFSTITETDGNLDIAVIDNNTITLNASDNGGILINANGAGGFNLDSSSDESTIAITSTTAGISIRCTGGELELATDGSAGVRIHSNAGGGISINDAGSGGVGIHTSNSTGGLTIEVSEIGGFSLYGLPTTDPTIANQLWNDGGTLKISSGA